MSTDFKPFLSQVYVIEVLKERTKILEDLVRYILAGAEDPYQRENRYHPQQRAFEADVRSRALTGFQDNMALPKRYTVDPGDTASLVVEAFKEGQRMSRVDHLCTPTLSSESLRKSFDMLMGTVGLETWKEAKPSVQGAYDRAMQNFIQCETRIASLSALHYLLKRSEYTSDPDVVGSSEIRETLWRQRERFLNHVATFGSLLGGQTAKDVTRLLALECCHTEDPGSIQFSVIHYLQADAASPRGPWSGSAEEKFRKDIKAKYDALGSKE